MFKPAYMEMRSGRDENSASGWRRNSGAGKRNEGNRV